MLGKVWFFSDELMSRYYELLTDLSLAEIAEWRGKAAAGAVNPMELKIRLASRIITDFHSAAAAQQAEEGFRRVFQQRQAPAEVETRSVLLDHVISASAIPGDRLIKVDRLLAKAGLTSSVSEAARKITAGALTINGERWKEPMYRLQPGQTELLVQVGRHYRRVILEPSRNTP